MDEEVVDEDLSLREKRPIVSRWSSSRRESDAGWLCCETRRRRGMKER